MVPEQRRAEEDVNDGGVGMGNGVEGHGRRRSKLVCFFASMSARARA